MSESLCYGTPPSGVLDLPACAFAGPMLPQADQIETVRQGSLDQLWMMAPPGTLERGYALATGLDRLKPGGTMIALAPKDRGGSRLKKELEALGCSVTETARRHHRICETRGPGDPVAIAAAIKAGGPQFRESPGLWTWPGVFSWDRLDTGTARLLATLPPLKGHGADFGCGLGLLAHKVLTTDAVKSLALIDLDHRAIECARRNVTDPRASFLHADVRDLPDPITGLDFIVMNPPFHAAGRQDRMLGLAFVEQAAARLRKGGSLWMVANVALAYEATLDKQFSRLREVDKAEGFKVIEAVR